MSNRGGFWDDVCEYLDCVVEFAGLSLTVVIHFVIWVCKGILWYFGLVFVGVLGMLAWSWIKTLF